MKYLFVGNNVNQSSISIYLFYLVTNLIYNYTYGLQLIFLIDHC